MVDTSYLTAKEAAAELNVSLATLYAYVSRGLIRSEAQSGSRRRLYRADDVRALATRRDGTVDHGAEGALSFGAPLLDSGITLITDDAVYYRGRDVGRLAAEASLEAVAGLIWDTAGGPSPFAEPAPSVPPGLDDARAAVADALPMDRCLALLALAIHDDVRAYNLTPGGVARSGARAARWIAAILVNRSPSEAPVHEVLADGWSVPRGAAGLIRAALVLCADHELNASAFAVRIAASTGATPYQAILAGLATLRGPRHGGVTERIAAILPTIIDNPDPEAALIDRLRRGDDLPGFGHPLYPHGDPRARVLLDLMTAAWPDDPVIKASRVVASAARMLAGRPPNLDYALAALTLRLGLPEGAGLGLFAAGRTIGWIGHALEQYPLGTIIRPRARYTGRHP